MQVGIKRRIAQALLLRESADFASIEDYRQWLDALVGRFNPRCSEALALEREKLQALPVQRTVDYSEQVVPVTTSGTIEVKRVLYGVPARLIGERLRLHIDDFGYVKKSEQETRSCSSSSPTATRPGVLSSRPTNRSPSGIASFPTR